MNFFSALALLAQDTARPLIPPELNDRVRLSGEAGVGYFKSGSLGRFPEGDFLVDEARLFLNAKVSDNVFLFSELNFAERELGSDGLQMGELFVEVEDLQKLWQGKHPLSLRAGRCDIPFGEEYLTRDAVDSPFISHSLADIWGVDEGVEIFGKVGAFDYTAAVQNGGYNKTHDGNGDKAVIGRLGFEPGGGLRLSASVMRTGDLDVKKDESAELWFGNSYLSPVVSPETTTTFHGDLAQVDARYAWEGGHIAGAFGGIRYDDNDSAQDNAARATYWSVEGVQRIYEGWYAGLRYSAIQPDDVFAAPGQAEFLDETYFGAVQNIWRLSADLGYRLNERALWKVEYSHEGGRRSDGDSIEDQNFVATEIAVGF